MLVNLREIIMTILLLIVSTFSLLHHGGLGVNTAITPDTSLLTNVLVDHVVLGYALLLLAHTVWAICLFADACLRPKIWRTREDVERGELTTGFARRALLL